MSSKFEDERHATEVETVVVMLDEQGGREDTASSPASLDREGRTEEIIGKEESSLSPNPVQVVSVRNASNWNLSLLVILWTRPAGSDWTDWTAGLNISSVADVEVGGGGGGLNEDNCESRGAD